MKEGKITILCLFMALMTFSASFGQTTVYSTIAKNINSEANSLQHNLNRAGDTLHLSSDYKLYKVEFIGAYEAKVFPVEGEKKQISIPLKSVPVGEYTIAAFQIEKTEGIYQDQKTIVFRISRLLPIEDPIEEELIAEAVTEPEIIEEEPIVIEEEKVATTEEEKEVPVKKERIKKERVVKKKVKKEITKEKKTRVTKARTPRPEKVRVEKEKTIADAKPVRTKTQRPTRVVEARKPSLDSTEYKSYNLTNGRGGRYVVQSREEYRAENLRPNGEPYN
ncbi:hypothetical protein Q4512_15400 [Oceanihabitans sp. 2_MG-2023]|uniref:hypothetical protein n=1 Tax=Oceanihabitans sp. 2_MG-2023 TaxID=3062661 RepID=UPI0026E204D6|nr:hypothetical protein [Oceanihabitans sp. 2_MG-2023]MDO6598309.1 hypothetical protein [Oceanihabitans sp. 2_MG-2023]